MRNLLFYSKKATHRYKNTRIQDEVVTSPEESWFVYSSAEKDEVDKYISSSMTLAKTLSASWYCFYETLVPGDISMWWSFLICFGYKGL
ncbi:hypothetical protein DEO72_LG5g2482 [Vigna unguiculata]|uniref:Uncharacterized protein n=1 Tax=Vigna unguiculata TaxID=3917 RepID=A0A4D6LZI4_VIGUN|nr:hypothetical protein DEO72_LG5g2482 [Vigna unguiculata]